MKCPKCQYGLKENQYKGVKIHLDASLKLLSDRVTPDYRNSIKEAISAVESLCQVVTEKEGATLGEAIKVLEQHGFIHKAQKSAFSSLYGFTNDSSGIRHALLEESNLDFSDAKFMLVTCASFVNLVIAKRGK